MLLEHDDYRRTPAYRELCHAFGIDPDVSLDAQSMPLGEAAAFWATYAASRQAASPRTAADIAGYVTGLIRSDAPGDLAVIATYGELAAVQDERGDPWLITVAPAATAASEYAIAAAMVADMATSEAGGGAADPDLPRNLN